MIREKIAIDIYLSALRILKICTYSHIGYRDQAKFLDCSNKSSFSRVSNL